jgi:hypothetical protein
VFSDKPRVSLGLLSVAAASCVAGESGSSARFGLSTGPSAAFGSVGVAGWAAAVSGLPPGGDIENVPRSVRNVKALSSLSPAGAAAATAWSFLLATAGPISPLASAMATGGSFLAVTATGGAPLPSWARQEL